MNNKILLVILIFFFAGCTKKQGKDYSSLNDAATDKIGVLMGSEQDRFITQKYPKAEVVRIDMATDLISALKAGSCDVVILTTIQARELLKVNPELSILQHDVCSNPLGVGFNKNDTVLRKEFNLFLAQIKNDGSYDQILERWTTCDDSAQMPEITLPTTGDVIRIGTTSTSSPYSFMKDGKLSGFDIEIVERFAAHMNRPVKFLTMNFGGLIPALTAGKVDVIVNYIMITPDRVKEIAFSDVYYESKSAAIAMKKDVASITSYRTMNDMSEKRIGVLLGSVQDAYITEKFPKAKIIRVDIAPDMLLALSSDKCDVIVLDEMMLKTMSNDYPEICISDEQLFKNGVGVGFQLENTALRDEFNKMLAELRKDGTYEQICKRWFEEEKPVMPTFDMPKNAAPLRVATSSTNAPFDYHENGEHIGFDVEMVMRFGQRIGRPVQIQTINFGGLIAAISSGKVDIIASGISITPERAKKVAFADPHYSSSTFSAVLKKNFATTKPAVNGYTSKEDMSTKCIAVLMGTTHDAFITKNFPKANIIRCESYSDVIMALTSEKCDAALFNSTVYSDMKKSNPQIEILDDSLFVEDAAIGFSLEQNDLKEQFNAFLKKIRANKLYDEIYDRWINNDDEAQMPEIKMATSGNPIRIGVSGTSVPFTFIRNGEHAGFDIELLRWFAQSIDRPVEFSVINFGGLISALSSGRVDVIAASMAPTPERAKQVNFSDSYFHHNSVITVLSKNLAMSSAEEQTIQRKDFFASIGDSFYNNLIAEKRYILILKGLKQTVIISIFAALLGTLLGALICFMRMSKKVVLNFFAKGYITLMRGIPVLVLLMLLYYAVFAKWDINATVVAIITFALNFAAYVSEMFRTSIEGVDRGQSEAGIALGFTKVQTFLFIIIPQAIKSVLPVYKGELISLIKMTSVVGYIAVEDLTKASDIIRSRTFDAFFPLIMVAIIYFLLAWGVHSVIG